MKLISTITLYFFIVISHFANASSRIEITPIDNQVGQAGDTFRFKYIPPTGDSHESSIFQLYFGQGHDTYSDNCKLMTYDNSEREYYHERSIAQAGEREVKVRERPSSSDSDCKATCPSTNCEETEKEYIVKLPQPLYRSGNTSQGQINEGESLTFASSWQHNYSRTEPETHIVDVKVRYRRTGSSSWNNVTLLHTGDSNNTESFATDSINFNDPGTYEYQFQAASTFELNSSDDKKNRTDWQGGGNFEVKATKFPDLILEYVNIDTTQIYVRETKEIKVKVKNQGNKISPASTVRYYLSNNITINDDDLQIGTDGFVSLAINDTARETLHYTFNSQGEFYIGACIDPVAAESDTDNNCLTGPSIEIRPAPETISLNGDITTENNILSANTLAQASTQLSRVSFAIYDENQQVINSENKVRVIEPNAVTYNSGPHTWGFNPMGNETNTQWQIDIADLAVGSYYIMFFATDGVSTNGVADTDYKAFNKSELSAPIIRVSPLQLAFEHQREQLPTTVHSFSIPSNKKPIKRQINFGNTKYSVTQLSHKAKQQKLAELKNNYGLMQFNHPMNSQLKQQLKSQGIAVLDYVPNNTYWVRIPPQTNLSTETMANIFWLSEVAVKDKVSPDLVRLAKTEQELLVYVKLFDDVSQANAQVLLNSLKGLEIIRNEPFNVTLLKIPSQQLSKLASLKQIQWLEFGGQKETSFNEVAAQRIKVDELNRAPFELTGENIKVGVWETALPYLHSDFANRITLMERDGEISTHATHVIGTIAGSGAGDSKAKGMAPNSNIYAFNSRNDTNEMVSATTNQKIALSNHSYGKKNGWYESKKLDDDGNIIWLQANINTFGQYTLQSAQWDELVNTTQLIIFKSAGNDRVDGPHCDSTDEDERLEGCDGPFTIINPRSTAKNIISVCATSDIDTNSSFSSWGPTFDGRVKPDLCANGTNILSTMPNNKYAEKSGTSMASPSAAGAGALLYEHFLNTHNRNPLAAEIKGLLIHGAKDLDDTGPDYKTGWGLINAKTSAGLITDNALRSGVINNTNETSTFDFTVTDEQSSLKFTLIWTDPAGVANAQEGPDLRNLVNNLDLILIDPQGNEHHSWILDPTNPNNPATKGRNDRDNIEQVFITENILTGQWQVKVEGTSIGEGPQTFHLISEQLDNSVVQSKIFTIHNDGEAQLQITEITPNSESAWLNIIPSPSDSSPLTIARNSSQDITVQVDTAITPFGESQVQLLISSNDTTNSPYTDGVYINTNIVQLVDSDGDSIYDTEDNCINTPNPTQTNTDDDALGDACDPDDDNDGVNDENDAYPLDSTRSEFAKINELNFYDPALRYCVTNSANMAGWTTIDEVIELNCYREQLMYLDGIEALEFVQKLNLVDNNISDISKLAELANLTDLDIRKNKISDITMLANLTKLEELRISDNSIVDLTPINYLTNLRVLKAENNNIENLLPLAQLTNLESLDLSHNNISDLAGLELLQDLYYLDVSVNQITDITILAGLIDIKKLNLYNNTVSDISPLTTLFEMENLNIEQNQVVDITAIVTMTYLQKFHARNNQIENIDGLDASNSLTDLDLRKNKITDISVVGTQTDLKQLRLSGNEITNLDPLQNLSRLELLTLSNNNFNGDISYLSGLTNLTNLYLVNSNITDISPLSYMASLKQIELADNKLQDIETLFSLGALTKIGLVGNEDITCNAISRLIEQFGANAVKAPGNCIDNIDLSAITDPQLHKCALDNIASNNWASATDATKLQCKDYGIKELQGIEIFSLLEDLDLRINQIEDISPLSSLTNLTELRISRNEISNATALSSLNALTLLSISENKLTANDMSIIGSLSKLEKLYLRSNNVGDLSFITNLASLKSLYLEDNDISELTPLETLKQIEFLELESNPISDITPLNTRTSLRWINLRKADTLECQSVTDLEQSISTVSILKPSQCVNIDELSFRDANFTKCVNNHTNKLNLTNASQITTLQCNDVMITDISGIEVLTKLTNLDLRRNQIANIKPISKLTSITELRLSKNQIQSIEPVRRLLNLNALSVGKNDFNSNQLRWLEKLNSLENIFLGSNSISDISVLSNLIQLKIVRLEDNNLTDITALYELVAPAIIRLTGNSNIPCQQLVELTHLFGENVVNTNSCVN